MLGRVFRIFGLSVLIIALLIAVAVGWLNWYVTTPDFAAQVKARAAELTGGEVDFRGIQWDMGRGLTLIGARLQQTAPDSEPGTFAATQIHLKYDWGSLLAGRFDVNRLTFKEPLVHINQRPNGIYVIPVNERRAAVLRKEAGRADAIAITLRAFNLDKGQFKVSGNNGRSRLEVVGAHIEGSRPPGNQDDFRMNGLVRVQTVTLWESIVINFVRSPFIYRNAMLQLTALEGEAYGGKLTGSWEQALSDDLMPYTFNLNLEGVDLQYFLSHTAKLPGLLSGRLEGSTVWLGPSTDLAAVNGRGRVEIKNGQIISVPLFDDLAKIAGGLGALAKPDFSEARFEFKVANQAVDLTSISVKSALFQITGSGTLTFDMRLRLKLKLALGPELARQLPAEASQWFSPEPNGGLVIPLRVAGLLNRANITPDLDEADAKDRPAAPALAP
jgi:type II secretion system protein N